MLTNIHMKIFGSTSFQNIHLKVKQYRTIAKQRKLLEFKFWTKYFWFICKWDKIQEFTILHLSVVYIIHVRHWKNKNKDIYVNVCACFVQKWRNTTKRTEFIAKQLLNASVIRFAQEIHSAANPIR